jgi:Zn-dependent protease
LLDINLAQVFIAFLVLLFSLTVHEAAHAWAADRCGDSTARLLGRLSLNPLVHIDPLGTVVFPLLAIVTHLPVFGWAKPVPINPLRLRHYRQDSMLIALAGPASNLLLAVAAALLLRVVPLEEAVASGSGVTAALVVLLVRLLQVNLILAIFNMLPIPPLDGAGVLGGVLPGPVADAFDRLRPYGFLLLYALMLTGLFRALVLPPYNLLLTWLL